MKGYLLLLLPFLLVASCESTHRLQKDSISAFNGTDLKGWINVNQATDNWLASNGTLVCRGKVPGYLSFEKKYTEYVLEFDYFSSMADSSAFVFFHEDLLPAVGSPFPNGQFIALKTKGEKAQWQHYSIHYTPDKISLSINGQTTAHFVSTPTISYGYFSFASYKTNFSLKNIRVTAPSKSEATIASFPYQSLYNNTDLQQWQMKPGHEGHWTAQDWVINYDGKSSEKDKCLWSKKIFRDFMLVADVRLTRKPEPAWSPVVLPNGENDLNPDGTNKQVEVLYAGDTGIYLRGDSKNQVNIGYRFLGSGEIYGYRVDKTLSAEVRAGVTPSKKADKPPGEWNRFVITLQGDRITVVLNNETVINNAQLPGIAAEGAIALQDDHADNNQFQFANLYIREL